MSLLSKPGRADLMAAARHMRAAVDTAAAARTADGKPDPVAAAAVMADALDRVVAGIAGSDPDDMPKFSSQRRLHGGGGE